MAFPEFLEKYVFPRAGLQDAVIDPTDITLRVAKSFDENFKQGPMKLYLSGWTRLTVDDFFRWSNRKHRASVWSNTAPNACNSE